MRCVSPSRRRPGVARRLRRPPCPAPRRAGRRSDENGEARIERSRASCRGTVATGASRPIPLSGTPARGDLFSAAVPDFSAGRPAVTGIPVPIAGRPARPSNAAAPKPSPPCPAQRRRPDDPPALRPAGERPRQRPRERGRRRSISGTRRSSSATALNSSRPTLRRRPRGARRPEGRCRRHRSTQTEGRTAQRVRGDLARTKDVPGLDDVVCRRHRRRKEPENPARAAPAGTAGP